MANHRFPLYCLPTHILNASYTPVLFFEKLEIKQPFLLDVRVKAEPLSPRDLHYPGLSNVQQLHLLHHPAQLQRPHSANSALSPHLSPNHIGQGNFSKNFKIVHFKLLYIVVSKKYLCLFKINLFIIVKKFAGSKKKSGIDRKIL